MTDDVYTIQLPGSNLQFTRYLFIKEEVRIALLLTILNKSDDAIFWAYELYYSGYKYELINLIWKIYYDFFATLNPSFEQYLLKKQKELFAKDDDTNNDRDRILSAIIQTLLFRPFNTDIWLSRFLAQRFIIDIDYAHVAENITHTDKFRVNMTKWVANKDYRSIIQWIYNENNCIPDICNIYDICLEIFNVKSKSRLSKLFQYRIMKCNDVNVKTILLAKIMALFTKNKKEKCIYVNVEPEEIIHYETITGDNVLENVYSRCGGIDLFDCLNLFKLTRDKYGKNLENIYRQNWEYHASFAPVWSQRIRKFGGYVDYSIQKVIFTDDDLMEDFYTLYGLEPDEQKKEVQNKSIGKLVSKYNWKWFSEKYKGNRLLEAYDEELEDFDQDKLTY
jgi:hypothetical protein